MCIRDRLNTFGDNSLSGIFSGYAKQSGGGWHGGVYAAAWGQIKEAEHGSQIHLHRISAK
eukprot:8053411-Karenia_brevis.AAC.1